MSRVIRELLVRVSIMSLGPLIVGARQTPAPPAAPAASTNVLGPKIQFATPLYDFGRVMSGEPVKYNYVFTNTGDAVLILSNVQPQCGCTKAGEWTKQVEPGKTGSIPIQFNTSAYNGAISKQVTVTCNVTNQPILYLQLKGTIYRPFDVNPPVAVFNLAPDAESASMVFTITNNTLEPLILSSPESYNRMFSAQLITNQLGKAYEVKVSIVPTLATRSAQSQIILKTMWTDTPLIPLTVVANLQPAVTVTPPYFNLAPGPLPKALTNSVTIQNNSATNLLKLSEPAVNVPGVEVEIRENQPGKSFSAMLAFPQGFQVPTGQQVELSLKTSNPKFPVVKVPVRQMQRPRPAPPLAQPDPKGFISLFNGKDLTGWEGLAGYWSVKNGVIDGSETKDHSVQTDLILSASREHPEKFVNFELHIKWMLISPDGNSGVQFRSVINNPQTLHVGGYQADIDSGGQYTGSIYDESGIAGGRGTMSNRGEKTSWDAGNKRHNNPLPESADDLRKLLHNTGDWNDIVLIVNGNHVQYKVNGHLMTELIDESPKAVLKGGVIALQMHAGFTMDIQFKDISIKFLDRTP